MSEELTRPSPHFDRFTDFTNPIDLTDGAVSIKAGQACRLIRATGDGTITLKRATDDTAKTLDFKDGESKAVQATSIDAVTGCTAVEVQW